MREYGTREADGGHLTAATWAYIDRVQGKKEPLPWNVGASDRPVRSLLLRIGPLERKAQHR